MDNDLQHETEALRRSWAQHDPLKLHGYLVQGVENPQINLQSIFSRHFLLREMGVADAEPLMHEECRFSAVINWLLAVGSGTATSEDWQAIHHALTCGADNAEGLSIPRFVLHAFNLLSGKAVDQEPGHSPNEIPNYIALYLEQAAQFGPENIFQAPALGVFRDLWNRRLAVPGSELTRVSVLEPACGSANDYRFLDAYGLSPWMDYTGFDLSSQNIANARAMFPETTFFEGNAFEIPRADRSSELCFVHDLFEHLSIQGFERAVGEICRVTAKGVCANFFQMEEMPAHQVRPLDEYHWNLLSMGQVKELFAQNGFEGGVIHVGTFLREQFGCRETHNPNAYTMLLRRQKSVETIKRAS
jgi:SAM-dependent methyltransferase